MLKPEVLEMAKELRAILGQINGAKEVQEQFSLEYIVVVESDEQKLAVEKVAETLMAQAEKKGLLLAITPATPEDLQKAKDLFIEHMQEQSVFKS